MWNPKKKTKLQTAQQSHDFVTKKETELKSPVSPCANQHLPVFGRRQTPFPCVSIVCFPCTPDERRQGSLQLFCLGCTERQLLHTLTSPLLWVYCFHSPCTKVKNQSLKSRNCVYFAESLPLSQTISQFQIHVKTSLYFSLY